MDETETKEVHHYHNGERNNSAMILMVVIGIVVLFIILFFFTGIGNLFNQAGQQGGVQVPEQVDVNVDTPQGGGQ